MDSSYRTINTASKPAAFNVSLSGKGGKKSPKIVYFMLFFSGLCCFMSVARGFSLNRRARITRSCWCHVRRSIVFAFSRGILHPLLSFQCKLSCQINAWKLVKRLQLRVQVFFHPSIIVSRPFTLTPKGNLQSSFGLNMHVFGLLINIIHACS